MRRWSLAAALLLALLACSSPAGETPGFSLSLDPPSLTLRHGESGTVEVAVTRTGGFAGNVDVSLPSPPEGISANPLTVSEGSGTLTIQVSSVAREGSHTLTVEGSSGTLSRTASLNLTVTPAESPDFMLALSPPSLSLSRGESATIEVTASRTGGFRGEIEISLVDPPGGISADALTLAEDSSQGTLALHASPTAQEGSHTLTVQGRSGDLVRVADLTLTVTPAEGASIAVTISIAPDAPDGVAAEVLVAGPEGYSRTLASSETLAELAPGSYTFTVKRSDIPPAPGEKVGKSYGDGEGVVVVDLAAGAEDQVSLSYSLQPASGKLWVSNNLSGAISAYDQTDLAANGSPDPVVRLEAPFSRPYSLAFDASGRLWVAHGGSANRLVAYAPRQLSGEGGSEPAITIGTSGALRDPRGLAFDGEGNLWISNWGNDTLIKYAASQLTVSGEPVPEVIISSPAIDVRPFSNLAFDAESSLWVTGGDGPPGSNSGTLVKFSADQLTASGNVMPAVTLYSSQGNVNVSGGSLFGGGPLAFDEEGNLWVVSGIDGLWKFGAADLASGGDLTPQVIIRNTGGGIVNQTGGSLAFDGEGNLWAAKLLNNSYLLMYSPAQLAGNPDNPVVDGTPTVQISGNALSNPFGLAFYPPPPGYPLH
jgi:hypothetical protein